MISSGRGYAQGCLTASLGGVDEKFPFIVGHLQLVQIERDEVVHKKALHLPSENENLGTDNVERVAVTTGWARTGG